MEYKEAVAEARTLVKRSEEDQWRLAELTWEQIARGATRKQWAKDVGLSPQYVGSLVSVWDRSSEVQALNRPPFNEAMAAVHTPGRFEEMEEQGDSRETVRARRAIRTMPPEQKAEVVREALQDEDVAEQVIRDTPTRARLARAEIDHGREMQETAKEHYDLTNPRSVQIGANIDLQRALDKARTAFEDAAEAADTLAAHGWPDRSRDQANALVQRALDAGEIVRQKLASDVDAELNDILTNGGDA
jgi:hypothetical protein